MMDEFRGHRTGGHNDIVAAYYVNMLLAAVAWSNCYLAWDSNLKFFNLGDINFAVVVMSAKAQHLIARAIFIARQHTDARYWYSKSVCLSVCLSVCPLRSGTRWKRLNISS